MFKHLIHIITNIIRDKREFFCPFTFHVHFLWYFACDNILAASGIQNPSQIHFIFYIISVIVLAVLSPRTVLTTFMVFISILCYFTVPGLVSDSLVSDSNPGCNPGCCIHELICRALLPASFSYSTVLLCVKYIQHKKWAPAAATAPQFSDIFTMIMKNQIL